MAHDVRAYFKDMHIISHAASKSNGKLRIFGEESPQLTQNPAFLLKTWFYPSCRLSCFGEVRQNGRGAARAPQNATRSAAAARRSRAALAFGFAERKARAAPP